jgi:hypothetical protein
MNKDLSKKILALVKDFNENIKDAIEGPNCIDPNICKGDCCFIHIDIPKALAQYFIENEWAMEDNFERSDTFSFQIAVDLSRLKCVFFDKDINGCSLHTSGMKPPQCWVYPTGLDVGDVKHSCKCAKGWDIKDPEKVTNCKHILEEYVNFCKEEFKEQNSKSEIEKRLSSLTIEHFKKYSPRSIAGIKDGWSSFEILENEGFGISMKPYCDAKSSDCNKNYFECEFLCEDVAKELFELINNNLFLFISKNGAKGSYLLTELKDQ